MRTLFGFYNRIRRSDCGVSSLELALILPVLLLMVFGLIEFGYNLFARTTVDKAALIGARYAVTGQGYDDGTRYNSIVAEAKQLTEVLTGSTAEAVTVTVSSIPAGADETALIEGDAGHPCDRVQVQVEYRYVPLTPLAGSLLGAEITVQALERMVNEPWVACK
ncbi:TadE/TadG family type IV pilus assembly protein [Oleidesulfovibrio sp.]|uniref:TadE/TadG family type IV pilus assembly protein n=1 Tax=Oleidesulfovibrio sp. TaxID=2909707 RepID=UPI003A89B144